MRRAALAAGILGALSPAAVAAADGGNSISAAPPLRYGPVVQGDSTHGAMVAAADSPNAVDEYHSFWRIRAIQGDRVTIDWHSDTIDMKMHIFARGTTDADYLTATTIVDSTLNDTNHATAVLHPTASGPYLVDFYNLDGPGEADDPGPYDYTATIAHRARLALGQEGHRLARTGSVPVGLTAPGGGRRAAGALKVALQLSSARGHFVTIGSATARGRRVSVDYRIPPSLRGHRGRLRALATGTGFVRSVSAERVVGVG